jgi:hypothetical protein
MWSLLDSHIREYWNNRENRRQFLIDLATAKGLDPFNPNTWTCITKKDVIAAKVSIILSLKENNNWIFEG